MLAAALRHRLIVSCQASPGDAFRDPASIARFAQAAVAGGAAGIRANGPADVAAIRGSVPAPIIGIQKVTMEDGCVMITPTFDAARDLVRAGADMIALDCTSRGQRFGALDRICRIKSELGVPVLADIATLDEARRAAEAGADFVLSTLRGYTDNTREIRQFEPPFIAQLTKSVSVPVIAEGRIRSVEQARSAVRAGAFAVVVGSAITRPHEISRMFAQAVEDEADRRQKKSYFLGIDLGGTSTKSGLVSSSGELLFESSEETPAQAGREALLQHLARVAESGIRRARQSGHEPSALGIATAGWVDTGTGTVVYATDNLPGWTGTPIAAILHEKIGLPVAVENDANATVLAEKEFGLARSCSDFVAITLGTGVGGGCYTRGALNRGAHFFANALGHIVVDAGGRLCTCGQRGCLEAYTNAGALLRYAGDRYHTAQEVIAAANAGVPEAEAAVAALAGYLARGCHTLVQLFDPEIIVFSGGLVQNNARLLAQVSHELSQTIPQWAKRKLCITASSLGYHVGVFGAATIAKRMLEDAYDSQRPSAGWEL